MGRSNRKYPRPKKGELQKLVDMLPQPLRVLAPDGTVLYQNHLAETQNGDGSTRRLEALWQDRQAFIEVGIAPSPAEQELEDLRAQVKQLQRSQKRTARKKRKAEKSQSDVETQLKKLKAERNKARQEAERLQKELDKQEREPGKSPDEVTQRHLQRLRKELDETRKRLQEEKARGSQVQQELNQQARQTASGAAQLESLQRRLDETKAQLEELQERLEEAEQKAERAHKDARRELEEDYKKQLAEMGRGFEEARAAQGRLSKELEVASERVFALQERQAELEEQLAEARSGSSPAQSGTDADRQELERLREQLEGVRLIKDEQKEILESLRADMKESRQREAELREAVKAFSSVREERKQLREEKKTWSAQLEELTYQRDQLLRERDKLKEELLERRAGSPFRATAVSSSAAAPATAAPLLEQTKQQLEWTKKRLRETEEKLDQVSAALKQEQEASKSAKETQRLAFEDTLTGLPNINILKKYLDFTLQQAARYSRVVALMVIDLDHFRVVNEALGMTGGDLLLKAVADRLKTMARRSDVLARRGEDEFVLMLSEVDGQRPKALVEATAERILESIRHPFSIQGHDFTLDCSIGISLYPSGARSADELVQQAEQALYQAKDAGRGRAAMFSSELKALREKQHALQVQMGPALDRSEFELAYQPIFSLSARRFVGFEAYLRWNHRQAGMLSPESFLEAAERTGMIIPIGYKALELLAAQLFEWRKLKKDLWACFNLSHRQLLEPNLGQVMKRTIQGKGLSLDAITLDVREEGQIRATGRWESALENLERLGFRLALDDFGLKETRVTSLTRPGVVMAKMEMSAAERLSGLVRSLSKDLKIEMVAKGVQQKFEPRRLAKAGFDYAQGFAVAEPMDGHAMTKFLSGKK